MRFTKKCRRGMALVMLMALLVSMLVLTVYASEKIPYKFSFIFDGPVCFSDPAKKDDGGYSAGASILRSNFNGGSVQFKLKRANYDDLSYWSPSYSGGGNYTLYYFGSLDLSYSFDVRLAGQATSTVGAIAGNFQP